MWAVSLQATGTKRTAERWHTRTTKHVPCIPPEFLTLMAIKEKKREARFDIEGYSLYN